MTRSSRRGSLAFRWLAVLTVLLTFLGPAGASAQGDASPVPPDATETVEPTTEPTATTEPTPTPTEDVSFAASADTLSLTAFPDPAQPGGDAVVVTGTVLREAAADETGTTTITIDIPAGMHLDPENDPVVSCSIPCLAEYTLGTGIVTGTFGSLTEESEISLAIYLVFDDDFDPSIGTIELTASGVSSDGTVLTAAPYTLSILPRLGEIDIDVDPNVAAPGDTVVVNVSYQMEVPIGAVLPTIEVTLPDGATFDSTFAPQVCAGCAANVSESGPVVTATFTTFGASGLITLTIQATIDADVDPGAVLGFDADGTGSNGEDVFGADDTVDIELPDAEIDLAIDPASAYPTQAVTVTVTMLDPGGDSVGSLGAELPASVTMVEESFTVDCGVVGCDQATIDDTGPTVGVDYVLLDDIPTTITFTFQVTVDAGVAPGTVLAFNAASDPGNGEPIDAVPVDLTVVAPPLVTEFQSFQVTAGETITGDVGAGVSGGVPPYTFSLNQEPGLGELTLNPDGTFSYTAPENTAGATSFAYTVTDAQPQGSGEIGGAASTGGEVQIVIGAADLMTQPLTINVDAGASVNGSVAGQASGGVSPYSFAIGTQPAQGNVTLNADGSFTYVADPDAEGDDQFTYTVTDSAVTPAGEVAAAASTTGVVDIIIAAPGSTPTETTVPGETPTVTPTTDPGEPTATATAIAPTMEPGEPTAPATSDPGTEPTKVPADVVTQLPSTGQGNGGSGSSMALLAVLLTAGLVLSVVAAGRLRRR